MKCLVHTTVMTSTNYNLWTIILVLWMYVPLSNAAIRTRQVLSVYSGEGIEKHFEKYYGKRQEYRDWGMLQHLSYKNRNILCLITYKATNVTTELAFRTTKTTKSILPYYIETQHRTLEINVNRCFVSGFEYDEEGEKTEVPWYEFYLAEAEIDHCVYKFSFPRNNGKEEVCLESNGVHALKIICDIDYLGYSVSITLNSLMTTSRMKSS